MTIDFFIIEMSGDRSVFRFNQYTGLAGLTVNRTTEKNNEYRNKALVLCFLFVGLTCADRGIDHPVTEPAGCTAQSIQPAGDTMLFNTDDIKACKAGRWKGR